MVEYIKDTVKNQRFFRYTLKQVSKRYKNLNKFLSTMNNSLSFKWWKGN